VEDDPRAVDDTPNVVEDREFLEILGISLLRAVAETP
jgi:hypothetical protein